jgi:plasmid stability protein
MVTLSVRRLDPKVIERLKARARTRGHSLEAELRGILTQASRQPLILDALAEADRIAAMTPEGMAQSDSVVPLRAGSGR